jgi:hypothetical protein
LANDWAIIICIVPTTKVIIDVLRMRISSMGLGRCDAGVLALEDYGFPASDTPQRDLVDGLMNTVRDYSTPASRNIVMAIYQSQETAQ